MAEWLKCLDCPKMIEKHKGNHQRCVMCAHAFNTKRSTERARVKRLVAKGRDHADGSQTVFA